MTNIAVTGFVTSGVISTKAPPVKSEVGAGDEIR